MSAVLFQWTWSLLFFALSCHPLAKYMPNSENVGLLSRCTYLGYFDRQLLNVVLTLTVLSQNGYQFEIWRAKSACFWSMGNYTDINLSEAGGRRRVRHKKRAWVYPTLPWLHLSSWMFAPRQPEFKSWDDTTKNSSAFAILRRSR